MLLELNIGLIYPTRISRNNTMGGRKGKNPFSQNQQLIFKNILNDETGQLKTKPTAFFTNQ